MDVDCRGHRASLCSCEPPADCIAEDVCNSCDAGSSGVPDAHVPESLGSLFHAAVVAAIVSSHCPLIMCCVCSPLQG